MRPQPGFKPHVTTLGQGPRRALALHCTMAFGGAWSGLSRALPDFTLIAPDMPSHGRSADWDEASSFADTVFQASLDVMDPEPMDVIGHSFGAVTALRLALAHPDRIRSLTVIEPVFFAVALRDTPEVLALHDQDARPFVQALQAGDRTGAARAFNRMWSADAPPWNSLPERNRLAMTRAIHVVPDTHAFLYDDTAGMLERGGLDGCMVPTLVMRGEHAHTSIQSVNTGLVSRMPLASEAVIPGAGHMAPISHPDAVAKQIEMLISQTLTA